MEGARIYAQNVIREKNQSLNFLRMSSRIDAVASRLESAVRMQSVTKAMGSTGQGMSNAMKSMQFEDIAKVMDEFKKQFEDMDVKSSYMEKSMDASRMSTTPPEQVDQLIQMVAEESGLQIGGVLDNAGAVSSAIPVERKYCYLLL